MIMILYLIKLSLEDNATFKPKTIEPVYPSSSIQPFSFLDYVSAVNEKRECVPISSSILALDPFRRELRNLQYSISGINILDWPVPFVKCDARKCSSVGQNATDFCSINVLALAPTISGQTDLVDAFEKYVNNAYPQLGNFNTYPIVKKFSSSSAVDEYVKHRDYGDIDKGRPSIAVAVEIGGLEKEYEYSIRTNQTNWNSPELFGRLVMKTQPSTSKVLNSFARQARDACPLEGGTVNIGPNDSHCTAQYMYNGALTIQRLVDDFILENSGAKDAGYSVAESGVSFSDFPSKEYVQDGFYEQIAPYAPLLLVLGLLYPFATMCRSIVQEKELRHKELMKMMSVSESAIELSWFISLYGFSFISGIFTTVISALFYEKASWIMLFIFWQFAFLAVVVFSMLVSAFFSKTTRATLVGILVFFAGYFLTLSADIQDGSRAIMSIVSLHPVAALTYGLQIIGALEDAGVGVGTTTISFSEYPSNYNFLSAIGSFIFSSIFWGLCCWYFNRVIPGDFGQALSRSFPFQKSYWCASKANSSDNLEEWKSDEKDQSIKMETVGGALKQQEKEGTGVHIRGLTKQYGDKTAVDGLDLSMYEGQVFALLGHNGAGKTTTINMLTGMTSPTSGYAIINGKNTTTEMSEIRQDVGICLQHDCLFPMLTVKEHLQFFCRIKGLYQRKSFQEAEEAVENSIRDVALFEKRNTYSDELSGGMKRKLSLAIAFCGDSKVVFLDEPTSGQDAFSRRFTWNVIRQNRQDRCIILTTHFMDEADLLGDRIGIMANGQLRCVGSALFLKKEFGVGYQITIEKKFNSLDVDEKVSNAITNCVPEAILLSDVSTELSFQLPINSSSKFVDMFASLDEAIEADEITTYGVSITTLEEVFLKVARGDIVEHEVLASSTKESFTNPTTFGDNDPTISFRSQEDVSESMVFARHVQSLLEKRALNFKRDKKAWVCSTILPCLFALFGFMNVVFFARFPSLEPLDLTLADFNSKLEGNSKRFPTPFNEAESFPCQQSECISNFEDYGNFCGNVVNINNAQCYDIDVSSISETMDKDEELFIVNQNVTSVFEASKQLPKNPTASVFGSSQYGGFYFSHSANSIINNTATKLYREEVQSLCDVSEFTEDFDCSRFAGLGMVISTNFTAPHASLLYQALADEAIMKTALGEEYVIQPAIKPLPFTYTEDGYAKAQDAFTAWFYLVLSFPFITGTFATFIVQERMSKAKHLQTVAGVKPSAYWLSSYIWDIINYQFPLWIVVILMYSFGVESFTKSDGNVGGGTILLLFLFGPAAAGFTYIVTFFFKSPSASNMFIIVFNFFIGLAGSLVTLILRIIYLATIAGGDESNLETIAIVIEWILRFIPSYNFAKGLLYSINIDIFAQFNMDPDLSVFSSDIMLYEIIFLAWQSVVYIIVAIYIDKLSTNSRLSNWFGSCCSKSKKNIGVIHVEEEVDEDVQVEHDRIMNGETNDDVIVVNDLRKQYPNGKTAVDGISLGIPAGQCFGLLGINGAGKTTTMSILTAEFPPTSGDATLAGYSVTSQPEETRKVIGYCPQFDAHFTNMTGREHVRLYAAIKGVAKQHIDGATDGKLAEVGLSEFDSNRLSSEYSGGMKRKLSVACATIGGPTIIFLDEPSTGMDPMARRDLWKVISNMVVGSTDTSVILTTHSMEECEALCPRIAIMAGGKFKCLGSAQRLKSRFGQGYQMELKVSESVEGDQDFNDTLTNLLTSASKQPVNDVENGIDVEDIYFTLEETLEGLNALTGDTFLSSKIHEEDPTGYLIHKNAMNSTGVAAKELTTFCATELRLKNLEKILKEKYPDCILRERQDTRLRFEVPSEGTKISSLFATTEEKKEDLFIADYGISQTTLEQVFNMHAAQAEEKKQGTDDG